MGNLDHFLGCFVWSQLTGKSWRSVVLFGRPNGSIQPKLPESKPSGLDWSLHDLKSLSYNILFPCSLLRLTLEIVHVPRKKSWPNPQGQITRRRGISVEFLKSWELPARFDRIGEMDLVRWCIVIHPRAREKKRKEKKIKKLWFGYSFVNVKDNSFKRVGHWGKAGTWLRLILTSHLIPHSWISALLIGWSVFSSGL